MRCYAFGLYTNLSCGLALVTYRQIKRGHTVAPDVRNNPLSPPESQIEHERDLIVREGQ